MQKYKNKTKKPIFFANIDSFFYLCTLFWLNMTFLCIETSTKVCSAALVQDGQIVAERVNLTDGNHAQLLAGFVDQLLELAQASRLSIDGVALSEGPGSYTGLRIGASLAKGLCYGLNLPLYPLPTPQILAATFLRDHKVNSSVWLCPMIDARRMEVYTALYDTNLQQVSPIEAKIIDAGSWQEQRKEHEIVFFGDGAMKCEPVLGGEHCSFVPDIVPLASAMGNLAERLTPEAIVRDKELAYFDPLYIKEFIPAPSHVKGL